MSQLKKSAVTLRIYGDGLDPKEITKLLGVSPTHAAIKGEKFVSQKTGKVRISKSGMWRLHASDCAPENIDEQIQELLSQVSADLAFWQNLAQKYKVNLFCGLFMSETNDGLAISPKSLVALGERGIELWFDIYAPIDDAD